MDLLAGFDYDRCGGTVSGEHVLLIGYTLPMIEFVTAFERAGLARQDDSIIKGAMKSVARKEADRWINAVKKELSIVPRPVEIFLAATFLMCRRLDIQGDFFKPGDLRRVFYAEVCDALMDSKHLCSELRLVTEAMRRDPDAFWRNQTAS